MTAARKLDHILDLVERGVRAAGDSNPRPSAPEAERNPLSTSTKSMSGPTQGQRLARQVLAEAMAGQVASESILELAGLVMGRDDVRIAQELLSAPTGPFAARRALELCAILLGNEAPAMGAEDATS